MVQGVKASKSETPECVAVRRSSEMTVACCVDGLPF